MDEVRHPKALDQNGGIARERKMHRLAQKRSGRPQEFIDQSAGVQQSKSGCRLGEIGRELHEMPNYRSPPMPSQHYR